MATKLMPPTAQRSPDKGETCLSVLILDDHELVRQGLAILIDEQKDLFVMGHTGSAAQAAKLIETYEPDIALLDVRLEKGTGLDVCQRVRESSPGVHCIMLTSLNDSATTLAAARAGAAALVLKRARTSELLETIRGVAAGRNYFDQATLRRCQEEIEAGEEGPVQHLTPQERRLFHWLGEGYSNREIAEAMSLTEKTVKNYVSNVLSKLGMTRRTQAAALSARLEERDRHRARDPFA